MLALSDRLRREGIDAILDQYESFPPQGWIQWMKQHVLHARFILVVCTETYCRRANGEEKPGVGLGATYESRLIQQLLYNTGGVNERFIPGVLTEEDRNHIPVELQSYAHYRLDTAGGYEEIYRLLTNQPKIKRPVLGRLRPLAPLQAKPDFRIILWNVPPRNLCFTGREIYLQAIHQTLAQTKAAAVSGIGGMGKTQTVIEYAHRNRGDYESVLWSSAAADGSLLSGFAALANRLELPERNEKELSAVAGAVSRWLESNSGWLLILDNVDTVEDLNMVRQLVPSASAGHLLITTRLHGTSRVAKNVDLERMEPEEGALFVLRRGNLIANDAPLAAASKPDRTLAVGMSNEVGGLPLALDQAGAFIVEMPSTPAEYLNLYRTEGARLRKLQGELGSEHPSVTITFSLAFSKLEEKNPAAADLLRACAFLAPDAIPEEIFTVGEAELGERLSQLATQPLDFAEAIKDAGRFALIRRNAVAKSLDIHRQVQEVLKDEMDPLTRRLWAERVVQALARVFPSPEFRNWTQCEQLLPHARVAARHIADFGLDSVPRETARLLNHLAGYAFGRADYPTAEPLFQRALAIREKTLGPDHPDTATSLNNLAELYRSQGRYQEAEPLYQRALAIREKALGPDHPDTLATRGHIASWTGQTGRAREALRLFRELLPDRERVLGPDHPDTLTTSNNIAAWTGEMGQAREALRLFRELLPDRERMLGPDHPDTLITRSNIALWTGRTGEAREALRLSRELLPDQQRVLDHGRQGRGDSGPDHPDTLRTRGLIASWTGQTGQAREALRLFRELLPDRERVLGRDHSDMLITRSSIAHWTGEMGQAREALRLFRELLPDRERVLGRDHPDTLTTRNNIASWTGQTGRAREALRLFRELLPDRERVLGSDHPDTLTTRGHIASWTGQTGRASEALRLFRELLPDLQRVLGPDHPDTLTTRNNIAFWTGETGEAREALRLLRELLPDQERVLGRDHSDTLITRSNIASWTGRAGEAREALRLLRELLPDQERVLGPDHPDTLRTSNNIAAWTGEMGEAREALRLFRKLLPDRERVLGPDHPGTLTTRGHIAHWTGQTGQAREALCLFQELLPDQERVLGPDHPDTLTTRGHIAHWTGQTGLAREALRLFRELLPDRERVLGPDHPDTLTTRGHIASWTGQTGEARGALRLFRELLPDLQRVLGPDHPDTLRTRSHIAFWTGETGEAREVLRLFRELLPDQERVLGPDHPDTLATRNNIASWTREDV